VTLGEAVALVVADQRAAGEVVQEPAAAGEVAVVRDALAAGLGATLPSAYAEFLQHCDGLDHDGLVLYGTGAASGLVERNRVWREAPGRDHVLVLGDTDLDLFVVSLDGTRPRLLDKVGGDVTETFPDVGSALVRLLAAHL
jgi:hypothetical protein